MAEPFKNLLNDDLVRQAAAHLQRSAPGFDAGRFVALATLGLDGLEFKARALHICSALEATLPPDFETAVTAIEAALAPPDPDDVSGESEAGVQGQEHGIRGWMLWPVGEFIARHGQHAPVRSLAALHALTQRFTAEFAIRPFIVNHPDLVFATLHRWLADPSAHVRRLVSEGSRPRLPWGLQLKCLVQDPGPTLPLLRALQDDPSATVRRSVANHLNDIAKDHPALVAQWLREHLPSAPAPRRALLRHASRTLIKQGDTAVLQAWGLAGALRGTASLQVDPPQVAVGGAVRLSLQLQSTARVAQNLAIDYAVHHVRANGSTSAKVFKGWQIELPAQGRINLGKAHSMRVITTRRYHAGHHRVTVQVNGREVAQAGFHLVLA